MTTIERIALRQKLAEFGLIIDGPTSTHSRRWVFFKADESG